MKEIIKKILREYDELDWIDNIPSEPVIVTAHNVYLGAKVRLRPDSHYRGADPLHQLGDAVGEIVLDDDGEVFFHEPFDNNSWVSVEWGRPDGSVGHQTYEIGPRNYDLEFAI
jgi:hypothetical protein